MYKSLLWLAVLLVLGNMAPAAAEATPRLPPLPVLGPTALTADASDGRAYLRWNLQLEDERVVGWKVEQLKPAKATITNEVLTEPAFVVRELTNGTPYEFVVIGVLRRRPVHASQQSRYRNAAADRQAKLVPLKPTVVRGGQDGPGRHTLVRPVREHHVWLRARQRSSFPTARS